MAIRLRWRIAVASSFAVLTACHPPEPAPSPPEPVIQYNVRWISNPAVDLMSPEGTFVRALVESFQGARDSYKAGAESLADGGFPGFDHVYQAVYGKQRDNEPGTGWWSTAKPGGGYLVGTQYYEIVSMRRDGDKMTAYVCKYGSMIASRGPDGKYFSNGSATIGDGDLYSFGPDPTVAAQHTPLANQRGAARKPADNVFGTWVWFDLQKTPDNSALCRQKLAPGTPLDWPNPYVRSDPPPTLPPDPGWPAASTA